jgi:hypothetical protein
VAVFQINFTLPVTVTPGDAQIILRQTTYDAMFNLTNTNNSAAALLPVQ